MKVDNCSVCGSAASLTYADERGRKTLYGVECGKGHSIGTSFETKNRAIRAWNECQGFMRRYS